MFKKYIPGVLILLSVFLLSACGGGTDAPATATMTISPSSFTFTDSTTTQSETTQTFSIVVKNAQGIPLNDVDIWISSLLAAPNAFDVIQLHDGNNEEGSPMKVKTDDNGVYILRVDFKHGNSLSYSSPIQVVSASISASADFDVDAGG